MKVKSIRIYLLRCVWYVLLWYGCVFFRWRRGVRVCDGDFFCVNEWKVSCDVKGEWGMDIGFFFKNYLCRSVWLKNICVCIEVYGYV